MLSHARGIFCEKNTMEEGEGVLIREGETEEIIELRSQGWNLLPGWPKRLDVSYCLAISFYDTLLIL